MSTARVTFSRRDLLRTSAVSLNLLPTALSGAMPAEASNTPKLCMYAAYPPSRAELRRIKQIGINVIDFPSMPPLPWSEQMLRYLQATLALEGLALGIVMIPWAVGNVMDQSFLKIVHGAHDRDEVIARVAESIEAAGRVGLSVIEYNFYAHRATEGYSNEPGRGQAAMQTFNFERMRMLPPLPEEGAQDRESTWRNLTYFLERILPVARAAGVRLSLHPNDPPPPTSRGSGQIMNSLADWKRLIATFDTPANGLTFDCGVTREIGEDPTAVCRYFASRDRMNQVHFRNVRMSKPRELYTEVFPDEGDTDMFAVMKTIVQSGYSKLILPEHPRGLDADQALPSEYARYTGWVYDVAYARALLQAALIDAKS